MNFQGLSRTSGNPVRQSTKFWLFGGYPCPDKIKIW